VRAGSASGAAPPPPATEAPSGARPAAQLRQLTALLAWAVVFCDIGTSVYYVPGILYETVGDLAPLFVALTTLGFVLLSLKYIEIAWRNPEGGGVVTVATKAFTPKWGCLGGMLITVDYFLTTAISSVAGFYYMASVFGAMQPYIPEFAAGGLILLALVNVIGIKESATLALAMALAALAVNLAVAGLAAWHLGPAGIVELVAALPPPGDLTLRQWLVGFGAAWLAFSGLESISQLSPAMMEPLRQTSRRAMIGVIVTILLTSPLLTLLAIGVLPEALKATDSERFVSELGQLFGGWPAKLAVVATATSLLVFAANTAIIGAYHVFLALAAGGFLPRAITRRNLQFGTPHVAILIATVVPVAIVLATRGRMVLLGDMYAFGLLGAFALSSVSLDVVRWRLRRRGPMFWIGLLTSLVILVAWVVNLFAKPLATFFGGGATGLGMLIAVGMQQGVFTELLYRIPLIERLASRTIAAAERMVEDVRGMVTLAQALEVKTLYPSKTLIAVRGRNPWLVREAVARVKGRNEKAIYCIYVEERAGLFTGDVPARPNEEGIGSLASAVEEARRQGVELVPIWTVSHSAADAIARAAEALGVDTVMVGVSRRSAIYHLLRGHVVKGLAAKLPRNCHLMLVT
jgi:amino acid transporter/nucleotide-binding universal stress UspA family protein